MHFSTAASGCANVLISPRGSILLSAPFVSKGYICMRATRQADCIQEHIETELGRSKESLTVTLRWAQWFAILLSDVLVRYYYDSSKPNHWVCRMVLWLNGLYLRNAKDLASAQHSSILTSNAIVTYLCSNPTYIASSRNHLVQLITPR